MKQLALILVLLLAAPAQTGKHRALFTPASASTTFIQGKNCFLNFNGSLSCSAAFNSNVVAGDLLIAVCGNQDGAGGNIPGTMAVTDSQGNTYTQRIDTGLNGTFPTDALTQSWLFTATAGSSAADTVTCTTNIGHASSYRDDFFEYTPLTTIDGTPAGGNNNTGTTGVTNVVTTTTTNVLITYAFVQTGTASVSSPAGFTFDFSDGNGNMWIWHKNNVTSGVQSVKLVSNDANPIHAGLIAMH